MPFPRSLSALLLSLFLAVPVLAADAKSYSLTILHTNDIHSRIAEFNRFGQTCTPEESAKGDCVGGYPRILAAVDAVRKKGGNILVLDAGDQFQGTLFYTVLKGRPSREALNTLRPTAITLGNHEFDNGPETLAETFLDGLAAPVLTANLDAAREPSLAGRTKPSLLVTLGGRKIGLLGLVNEDTPRLSSPGPDLAFADALAAAARTVKDLRSQGATIVVAVTHLGLDRDKELAAAVDGLDVVVGGHSHTLLSNTDPQAAGPYPVVVDSPSGKPVLVVQAGAWGKYLGELRVDFDVKGAPVAWHGDTILLDTSKPQDPAFLAKVEAMKQELAPYQNRVVGKLADSMELPRDACRFGECTLGDLMADALRLAARPQGAQAALFNGGGIRAGLKAGDVTAGDLLTMYPFGDSVATFELSGKDLLAALEHGVSLADKPAASGTGRFLQVSGLRFAFDSRRPVGQRVVSAEILGFDGAYTLVNPDKTYTLATSPYLLRGGDGFTVFKEKARKVYAFGKPIGDALVDFLSIHSPYTPRLEGRIVRLSDALPK